MDNEEKEEKKWQFSKVVLGSAIIVWVLSAGLGWYYVFSRDAGLLEILTYIGSPVAVAYGFYSWKAKAENVIKMTKAVEEDKKISKTTKEKLIKGVAKVFSDIETEE